jgi:hypothetical protein
VNPLAEGRLLIDLTWVRLVADEDTPIELATLDGRLIGLAPGTSALPERGVLFGVPGWSRQVQGQEWQWEWVMTGAVDRLAQFVDSIPGAGGWKDAGARTTYLSAARTLRNAGIPVDQIRARLPALYSAAVTNQAAQ